MPIQIDFLSSRIKQAVNSPIPSASSAELSPTFVLIFTLQQKSTSPEEPKNKTFKDISYFRYEFNQTSNCFGCSKKTYLSTSFTSSTITHEILIKLSDANYYPAASLVREQHLPGIIDFSGKIISISDSFELGAKGANIFITIQQHSIT